MDEGCFLSPSIAVRTIPGKGRGVVATDWIAPGETVECSPILICPAGAIPETGHPLSDYVFGYGEDLAVGLGYASLYNHSRNPNCRWEFDDVLPVIRIIALREIVAGDELTIDYGIALWFAEA